MTPPKKTPQKKNTKAAKPAKAIKPPKAKNPVGRPPTYDRQVTMKTICDLVADKHTLNQICKRKDMPSNETVREWMLEDDELAVMYACARELRADARADRIDELTQMVLDKKLDPAAARVIIDSEKWLAGKELPKRYGEKMTLAGDPENPLQGMTDEQLLARLESLRK